MSNENLYKPSKQIEGAPPVTENPKLGRMEDAIANPPGAKAKGQLMPASAKAPKGGKNAMGSFRKTGAKAKTTKAAASSPQEPKKEAKPSEGYVRLHVRVDNGQMSVIGSQQVDGPLAEVSAFPGGHAYEVTLEGKRLHAGALPDLNLVRSFPNPNGPPQEQLHHTYELPTYDFNVRVPRQALTSKALSKVEVALYRVKDTVPKVLAGIQPLADAHDRELREVARMKGLPATVLKKKS
jgi:hypothetical protein